MEEEDSGHTFQPAVVRAGESNLCWWDINDDIAWG